MPGTIRVSIVELEQPAPSAPPTPIIDWNRSSLSLKVTTGKREYQTMGNMELSFPIVSMRDNMVVMLNGPDGKIISRAELKVISVVEKGILDDSFSLEGGITIRMRVQFLLSEEERLRIHELRNSKLKRQHGDLLKEDLAIAGEKVRETMPTYNAKLKMEGIKIRQSKHINQDEHIDLSTSSTQPSVQDSENHTQDLLDSQIHKSNEIDEGTKKIISLTGGIQGREIFQVDSSNRQREHAASVTSGNSTDGIIPSSTKLEEQRCIRNSFAISARSNVRSMISAFEKNPSQGLESNVVSNVLLLSKNENESSLKRTPSEESISKKLVQQTMAKSCSSGALSDVNSQNNSKFPIPHLAKKQEGDQPTMVETRRKIRKFLDFDQKHIRPDATGQNVGKEIHLLRMYRHKNQDKIARFLKGTMQSGSTISESPDSDDPCGTGTLQQVFYCRWCRGHAKEQLSSWNLFEPTELLCNRTEECVFNTFGIWAPRHFCITTGSKRLRNLLERCRKCLGSLSVDEKFRPEADEKENVSSDSSIAVAKNENISSQSPGHVDGEDVTGNSNSYGKLIDQGVRIIIVIVACGTLLLRTR